MRKRHQRGCLQKISGSWVAQWREVGRLKKKALGRTSEMTKSEAMTEFDVILASVNGDRLNGQHTLEHFMDTTYLPFYKRKWKASTAETNESRVRHHILGSFGGRELSSFTRVELQDFLDAKAESLSYSVVDHLKWDLRQILELGKAEGFLERNPAALLFTPRAAQRPTRKRLNWKEVQQLFNVLDLRERLIAMLAVLAGMRPGEILALQWKHVRGEAVSIRQRVYRGLVDTPKSRHSVRDVALPAQLQRRLGEWKTLATDSSPKAWVFSSEAGSPLKRDNIWRRNFRPRLQKVGLEWANFQVMRRTHSTLMRELGIDPKLVADQQGHTVDVNLNVYTKSSIDARKKAVERLENKLFPALTMPM